MPGQSSTGRAGSVRRSTSRLTQLALIGRPSLNAARSSPVLEGQRHVLFSGGPVQPNQVMLLYRLDQLPDNSHHVFDGVCLGGDMELVDKILTTSQGKEAFRAYVGYSGWGPGQLESEMRIGSWITVPADPAMVFEKDPTRVWSEIVSALGEEFRLYADMPFDPSLN